MSYGSNLDIPYIFTCAFVIVDDKFVDILKKSVNKSRFLHCTNSDNLEVFFDGVFRLIKYSFCYYKRSIVE